MKLQIFVVGTLLASSAAFAQEAMDDSAKNMAPEEAQEITKLLIEKTSDPYSAQIIRVRQIENGACGLINLKNQYGGFTGFQPFMILNHVLFLQDTSQCRN